MTLVLLIMAVWFGYLATACFPDPTGTVVSGGIALFMFGDFCFFAYDIWLNVRLVQTRGVR